MNNLRQELIYREGLGDLPEDHELTREIPFNSGETTSDYSQLFGYQEQAHADFQNATIGNPEVQGSVETTYDARPINGQDFIVNGGTVTHVLFGYTNKIAGVFSFLVPAGYVLVLRGFKYTFNPIYAFRGMSGILLTLSSGSSVITSTVQLPAGGSPLTGYNQIKMDNNSSSKCGSGQFVNNFIPCYSLVQPGTYVNLSVIGNFTGGFTVPTAFVGYFYGQLLPFSGKTLSETVANPPLQSVADQKIYSAGPGGLDYQAIKNMQDLKRRGPR